MGCTVQPSQLCQVFDAGLIIRMEQEGCRRQSPKPTSQENHPKILVLVFQTEAKERSYASFCSEESIIPTVTCSSVITTTVPSL